MNENTEPRVKIIENATRDDYTLAADTGDTND